MNNSQNNQSQASSNEFNGQRVSAQTFAAKFKSKKEIFNFLTVDAKAFLPPYDTITIYHMRDIVSGTKKVSGHLDLILIFECLNFVFACSTLSVTP
jgi:hypothetical protein